MVKDNFK